MSEVDIKVIDLSRERYGDGLRDHVYPMLYRTVETTTVAKMAIEMCSRWGMVAATPDGEDTAGRQRLRSLEPDELADKACRTAQALWMRFERLGWLVAIPDPRPRKVEDKQKEEA